MKPYYLHSVTYQGGSEVFSLFGCLGILGISDTRKLTSSSHVLTLP